jgi:hypothetical protein
MAWWFVPDYSRVKMAPLAGCRDLPFSCERVLLSDCESHAVRQRDACVSLRSATDAQVVVLVVVRIMCKRSRLLFSSTFSH